ncbi:hypothetical protein MNBD_GAMMA12-2521 [hydrothermal vent metagenome]|uniref:Thioesterase domain-containing protein n=1 Tax=hydrothermal vent metagenome TaxID=652676 RepID=A0A3B0YU78_9ZZZZ
MNKNNQQWIKCYRESSQSKLKVFCFPFAGGSASAYRLWKDYLSEEIDVYAIQLPGREERISDPLLTDLKASVKEIADEILPLLDKDFVFFGHSMGAVMALELAHILEQQNKIPRQVIVSARCSPLLVDPETQIHQLSDKGFVQAIRDYNGTSEIVLQNKELMAMFLPILRADFSMSETYQYSQTKPLSCPLTAICGIEEKELEEHHITGWQAVTTGAFTTKMFAGGHFFIKDEIEVVLPYLNNVLNDLINKNVA